MAKNSYRTSQLEHLSLSWKYFHGLRKPPKEDEELSIISQSSKSADKGKIKDSTSSPFNSAKKPSLDGEKKLLAGKKVVGFAHSEDVSLPRHASRARQVYSADRPRRR